MSGFFLYLTVINKEVKKQGRLDMAGKKVDFGFVPSEYQEKIFDFVQHGVGNAVIHAFAGSGKSSTMISAMKLIPKNRKCLFIAFNKSIVKELSEKLDGYPNCQVMTIHSLGFSMLRKNFDETEFSVDEYKYRNYLRNNIRNLSNIDLDGLSRSEVEEFISSVVSLIDFSRFNLCQKIGEIKEIAERYNIPLVGDECEVVRKCMMWGKKNLSTVDYTDMVWLPYELSLSPKGNQFDWVFFDEAQDASMASVDLFKRTFKRGTRFCAVGDTFQAINLFAGSSVNAFETMTNYPNTQVFDLPISYRCDKEIIALSQTIVPGIQYRSNADDGSVRYNCHLSEIKSGDMVLCRSKAPLVKLYTRLVKQGVKCYIKGSELGDSLVDLLKNIQDEGNLSTVSINDMLNVLYKRLIDVRNHTMDTYGLDIWDASLSVPVMKLYDEINVITAISDGCTVVSEVIEKIEGAFMDESDGICLSTIHKAKGLEADNVYIICRSTMPPKRIKQEWQKIQEENLIYVAYTRARHILGFVDEKEVPPAGSSMTDDDIVNDIAFIEKRVCSVFGNVSDTPDGAKFRLKSLSDISEIHKNDNVVSLDGNKQSETSYEEISLDDLLESLG